MGGVREISGAIFTDVANQCVSGAEVQPEEEWGVEHILSSPEMAHSVGKILSFYEQKADFISIHMLA